MRYVDSPRAKIALREAGWKWDAKNRRWVLEKYGVRIAVRGVETALTLKLEKIEQ